MRMIWRVYPIYVVLKDRLRRIEEIRERKEIYDFLDSASPEEMKKLRKQINHKKIICTRDR